MKSTGATHGPVYRALGWAAGIILYSVLVGFVYSFLMVIFFFGDSYEPVPESGVYHKTATIARTLGIRWVPSTTAMWIGLIVTLILAWSAMFIVWLIHARNRNYFKQRLFNYRKGYRLLTKRQVTR